MVNPIPEVPPRKLRLVHGTVEQIEDWINAHWDTYAVANYTWAVIDGKQMVTITAILGVELERAMRMQQLAAQGQRPPGWRQ